MGANTPKRHTGLLAAGLILCALIARELGQYSILPIPLGLAHTVICIGLCIGWGISVDRRIVQNRVRVYMLGVSAMSVFWFVTRSIKYFFTADPGISRYLWYSYYIPMLFIPLLVVLVALSLGKPETYRPSWWVWLLAAPVLLSLVVLTNDLHQLVFIFPEGQVWSDNAYCYGCVFYLIWIWGLFCTLAAFFIMLTKCRLAKKNAYLPAVLILLVILYSVIYVITGCRGVLKIIAGDMVMVLSLLIIGILESAIRCGLIQTNTGYAELFAVGTIGAQIADSSYQLRFASVSAPQLTEAAMRAAKDGSVYLDRSLLLKGQAIPGGYVYWQEDNAAITALLEKMEETRAAIAENNHIDEESLRVKRELHALREKNRLYDLLQAKVAPQIDLLNRLFDAYNGEADETVRRSLLGRIAVVGVYIKRYGNLLYIGERSAYTDTAELSLCMEESFAFLSLMGIECAMDIPGSHRIATEDSLRVYDFFEQVTETAFEGLRSVWLKARILEDSILFRLEVECEVSLSALSPLADICQQEADIWSFALRIGKAGEAP